MAECPAYRDTSGLWEERASKAAGMQLSEEVSPFLALGLSGDAGAGRQLRLGDAELTFRTSLGAVCPTPS